MADRILDRCKAIIFDFDGVLVDSNIIKVQLYYDIWPFGEKYREFISKAIADIGSPRFAILEAIYAHVSKFEELKNLEYYVLQYSSLVENEIVSSKFPDGVLEFLEQNNERLLLINSQTPEEVLKEIVSKKGLDKYITEVRGWPGTKEGIIQYYMDKYDLSSEDLLFVGDSDEDMLSAGQFNITFVGIKSNGHGFRNCTPDPFCANFNEMGSYLEDN